MKDSASSAYVGEKDLKQSRSWIPLIIFGLLVFIGIAIVLYRGWCTGDTSKPGNSLTLSNHPDPESCRDAAARLTTANCVQLLTSGLNTWAAAQPCTAHAGCKGCQKVAVLDTSDASLKCVADGHNRLNLVCYNFGYELDCDCL